jgi:hypothetical protein
MSQKQYQTIVQDELLPGTLLLYAFHKNTIAICHIANFALLSVAASTDSKLGEIS